MPASLPPQAAPALRLHGFATSGASNRVRIALAFKGLAYEDLPVDLLAGRHHAPDYRALNPQGLVPALEADGRVLTQSAAILEWLEERWPEPPLLPRDPEGRARVRALAAVIGSDIHPIHNGRVQHYLRARLGCDEDAVRDWCRTWIADGFDALEALLAADPARGSFCCGGTPTLAEVYLVPQLASARRFGLEPARWPLIAAVERACTDIAAFRPAQPARPTA